VIALVAKLIMGWFLPFAHDEAYYWTWARDLRLSYLDHPPAIAWLFWLGLPLENFGHASRWPAIVLGHSSLLPWYIFISSWTMLPPRTLSLVGWTLAISPFFGVGGLIATPDLPLMAFWSWAALLAWLLDRTQQRRFAAALGALLGLGFLSKYVMVVFPLAAIVYLTWSSRWRTLGRWHWTLAFGAGLLFSSPVVIWNLQNDFAGFRFQLSHGLAGTGVSGWWPVEYLIGQIALLSPAVAVLLLGLRRVSFADDLRFLLSFAGAPLGFFLLSSFRAPVEANWPLVAQGAALTTAAIVAVQTNQVVWLKVHLGVWATASAIAVSLVIQNWTPLSDKTLRLHELHGIARNLSALSEARIDFTSTYQNASALSYALRKSGLSMCKLPGINRFDMYDMRSSCRPLGNGPFRVLFESHEEWDRLVREAGWEPISHTALSDSFSIVEVRR
jgi:4-amino-4-deoxy-L-arabinose transferase-like glycosyltransferase